MINRLFGTVENNVDVILEQRKQEALNMKHMRVEAQEQNEDDYDDVKIKKYKCKVSKNNMNIEDIKEAVIYCRVSSGKQKLKAQDFACRSYCDKHKLKIIHSYYEVHSAYKKDRVVIEDLLNSYSNVYLIVNNVDRFSRNIETCNSMISRMEEKNIILKSVHEEVDLSTPYGKHKFRELVSYAQLESEKISSRIKNNIKYKKENNLFVGSIAPFGFKINAEKQLEPEKSEALILKFMSRVHNQYISSSEFTNLLYNLMTALNKPSSSFVSVTFYDENKNEYDENKTIKITYEIIADILNDYEITKRGKEWNKSKVYTTLRNNYNLVFRNFTNLQLE